MRTIKYLTVFLVITSLFSLTLPEIPAKLLSVKIYSSMRVDYGNELIVASPDGSVKITKLLQDNSKNREYNMKNIILTLNEISASGYQLIEFQVSTLGEYEVSTYLFEK